MHITRPSYYRYTYTPIFAVPRAQVTLKKLLASGSFAEVYKVEIKGKELAAKVYYGA